MSLRLPAVVLPILLLALALFLFLSSLASAQNAQPPAKVQQVMQKLAAFENAENAKAEKTIAAYRQQLVTKLESLKNAAMQRGDLDAATAYGKLVETIQSQAQAQQLDAELPPVDIPGDRFAKTEVEQFQKNRNKVIENRDQTILAKQKAVVDYLNLTVKELTRSGAVDEAVATKAAAKSMQGKITKMVEMRKAATEKQQKRKQADSVAPKAIIIHGRRKVFSDLFLHDEKAKFSKLIQFKENGQYLMLIEAFQSRAANDNAQLIAKIGNSQKVSIEIQSDNPKQPGEYTHKFRAVKGVPILLSLSFDNDITIKGPDGKIVEDRNIYLRSLYINGPLFGVR